MSLMSLTKSNSFAASSSKSSSNSSNSNSNNNSKSLRKAAMKLLLPHRRRQNKTVQKTAVIVDDYTNLLRRISISEDADGTVATASSHMPSSEDGSYTATSTPCFEAIAALNRSEVHLGCLLGKGAFSKVCAVDGITLAGGKEDPARAHMANSAQSGRYVMKRLQQRLTRSPKAFTSAAANLMMEAHFLGQLDHPHILKLRATAAGGSSSFQHGHHDGYFLILDRLSETLEQRIHSTWRTRRDPHALRVQPLNETALLQIKLQYALELASALQYLHERRIVFRDVKPSNLGFDTHGTLKLFDFGLARQLPEAMGLPNELFHMTRHAGTRPYTAVEVATTGLYNEKADTYAWAMVVYEMVTEQVPFQEYAAVKDKSNNSSKKQQKPFANDNFVQAVYVDKEMPSFDRTRSPLKVSHALQTLLKKCWSFDLFVRPNMEQACMELQALMG